MKSIGGYLGMEFSEKNEYHTELLRLNTGRNALEYILRARNYKRIFIPYYACDALLEPVKKTGIRYEFYKINEQLDPVIDSAINSDDCFLYINYFGVKNGTVEKLAGQVSNLIIDNSQSFFSLPTENVDTFYSCRKFFGVPDGAYLSTSADNKLELALDHSYDRCAHLLKNIDCGVEEGYKDFLVNEEELSGRDIKQMSVLTQTMMSSVDYVFCKDRRNENFRYLNERIADINELNLNFSDIDGPLGYPLLVSNNKLRKLLIGEKIYIPDYWPNVRSWAGHDTYEYFLSENILTLPVDQRYDNNDMDHIVKTLFNLV